MTRPLLTALALVLFGTLACQDSPEETAIEEPAIKAEVTRLQDKIDILRENLGEVCSLWFDDGLTVVFLAGGMRAVRQARTSEFEPEHERCNAVSHGVGPVDECILRGLRANEPDSMLASCFHLNATFRAVQP